MAAGSQLEDLAMGGRVSSFCPLSSTGRTTSIRLLEVAVLTLALLLSTACRVLNPPDSFDPLNPDPIVRAGTAFDPLDINNQLDPELLNPPKDPYILGVGDVVEIEIAGIPGTRNSTFILPDGKLYYDLAGGVYADGLTIKQLAERLTEALSRDYSSPSVNVSLREVNSRRYWVLGRVFKPGLYPLQQPTTLLEAISDAGGLFTSRFSGSTEELADLGNSFVLRNKEVLPVDFQALLRGGDMSQNIYLYPDDYIYLPSSLSQNVYVLGAVRQPQAIGYKDRLTLVGAISAAKGPGPLAHLDQVVIVRDGLSEPRVAVVDLKAILTGRARNVELRPFDIVWVPDRPFEKIKEYFWVILNTATQTIAVREGARAVDADSDNAPVIPID
jgi:polysaccharide export outer membrane protein